MKEQQTNRLAQKNIYDITNIFQSQSDDYGKNQEIDQKYSKNKNVFIFKLNFLCLFF
jgi:hypothetical protein